MGRGSVPVLVFCAPAEAEAFCSGARSSLELAAGGGSRGGGPSTGSREAGEKKPGLGRERESGCKSPELLKRNETESETGVECLRGWDGGTQGGWGGEGGRRLAQQHRPLPGLRAQSQGLGFAGPGERSEREREVGAR